MLPISGVYEVAIRVKDLAKAEPFYREVLGLEIGLRVEARNMVFPRAGGDSGMVVLQQEAAEFPTQHFAFTVDEANIERAAGLLREKGVEVNGPVFHEWMPVRSVYLTDPDGHPLELCAPLRNGAS